MIKHIRFRYKHMLPRDKVIWDRFLEQHGVYFERFDYDTHVGEGIGDIVGVTDQIRKIALSLTQKRIDAVGYKGSEIWVFEIKPKAGLAAVGQIISYRILYDKDFGPGKVTHKAIVTDRTDNDIRTLCRELSIRLYEVG